MQFFFLMTRAIQLLFLFLIYPSHANELTKLTDLNSLQWKNRIVVVNNVRSEEKIVALFENNSAAINDRDIVWFVIKGDSLISNYPGKLAGELLRNIRSNYKLGQGETVLVGKDGGIKSRLNRVDVRAIFSGIDAMPMRQREMQN